MNGANSRIQNTGLRSCLIKASSWFIFLGIVIFFRKSRNTTDYRQSELLRFARPRRGAEEVRPLISRATQVGRMKRNVVISIVAVAALIAAATFLALNPSANGAGSATRSEVKFTIIASPTGFNRSTSVGAPWPQMTVHQGQTVTIQVENKDPVEPHGFTVAHYFDSGVTLRPGQTYTLTFLADQRGTFRVYCNIFCTVHIYMQSGQLTVE